MDLTFRGRRSGTRKIKVKRHNDGVRADARALKRASGAMTPTVAHSCDAADSFPRPPTLIASIFGMNFEAMTWFKTGWGPWVGFLLMFMAPAMLFGIAKWRKWF